MSRHTVWTFRIGLVAAVLVPSARAVEPHVEFTGFVGERAAELLDGRVLSSFARVDAMDEAVRRSDG